MPFFCELLARRERILKGVEMKTAKVLFIFVVASTFMLTACGSAAPAAEPAPVVEQPTAVVQPTSPPPPPQPTVALVEPQPAAPAQPQYAAFCEAAAPTGCEAPAVTMIDNKYCVNKVPYAIMSVAAGTTYQSQDPDMECVDQMNSDGTLRVTCHSISGKQLWSYDMKVCNGSCTAPALQMGTGQCPEGYGFDAANQCCSAPSPSSSDGCSIYKVDLGACPEG